MKSKTIKFHSQWQTGKGWEPTNAMQQHFDHIEKIGKVNGAEVFLCISAFGENHILIGIYENG